MSVPPPPPPQQPYSYTPPQPQAPQPPQKSSGCLKWTLIGCSVLLVIAVIGVAVLVAFVFGAIKSTDVYKNARDRAIHDPRVIAALGSPVQAGFWVSGNVHVDTREGGNASIKFPISGPKGKASVEAVATVENDKWVYSKMTATPDGGSPIDLLHAPGELPDRPLKF
jgi:hypothetical protein